ncbi:MAG: HAMP domain-containing sensor histidine kinase [bacterium]|nr:HAMP domain-containing sensor histidine kinase [bacterium]
MTSRSVFKSFRFEVVLYSILSLLYTIATEAILYCFAYYIRLFSKGLIEAGRANISMRQALQNAWNMPIQNNTSFLDGSSSTGLTHSLTSVLTLNRDYLVVTLIFAFIIGMILFTIYFLMLTRRLSNYLYEISDGIKVIASGKFESRIRVKNEDEFAVIAASVNKMASDINEMMENERKNEQLKHELITNVAHDLRTPLTSIIGYLELSQKAEISTEDKEHYVAIAYDKSKRLQSLIEDLFSYTKFSSGEVKLSKQEIDLLKLLQQMIDEFYPSFQDANLEYELVSNVKRAMLSIDGNLLARAIANLISNAIKYGKKGKKIKVELEKTDHDYEIAVVNYGAIIPQEDIPYIFDKFYRVETSRSMDTGGTGLGLAIAKKIVNLHDGELSVSSDAFKTEFKMILPYKE